MDDSRNTLFWNAAFPVFMLVMFGGLFGGFSNKEAMHWSTPGMVVLNIVTFGLIGSPTNIVNMREKGVLWRLHGTPTSSALLIVAYVAVNTVICLLFSVWIVGVSVVLFAFPIHLQNIAMALPMTLIAIIASIALGQVIGGVSKTISTAIIIGQVAYFAQLFISDMITPSENLPALAQQIGAYTPAHAIAQLIRPPLLDGSWGPNLGLNLLLTLGYAFIAVLIASKVFSSCCFM